MATAQVNAVIQFGANNVSNNVNLPTITTPEGNAAGYFALFAAGASASNCAPFYRDGVIYQVNAANACRVVWGMFLGDTAGNTAQLMSATASFATNATTASLTGPKYQMGQTGYYIYKTVTANIPVTIAHPYVFATSSFPGFINAQSGQSMMLICRESLT